MPVTNNGTNFAVNSQRIKHYTHLNNDIRKAAQYSNSHDHAAITHHYSHNEHSPSRITLCYSNRITATYAAASERKIPVFRQMSLLA